MKVFIMICVIASLQTEVLSRPSKGLNEDRPLTSQKPSSGVRVRHIQMKVPTTKSTIIKSFAVSNNVAFTPVGVLNRHAIAHKTIQKKIEGKKNSEKAGKLPSICFPMTTEETPTDEKYDNSAGKTRSNTLFTSHNWGNQK
jgi:hypothetical protein